MEVPDLRTRIYSRVMHPTVDVTPHLTLTRCPIDIARCNGWVQDAELTFVGNRPTTNLEDALRFGIALRFGVSGRSLYKLVRTG